MTAAARLVLAALSCALGLRRTGRTRRFRRVGIFVVRLILPRGAAFAVFLGAAVGTLTASAVCLLAALRLFAAAFCILFLGFGLFAALCMALAAASAAAMPASAAAGAALFGFFLCVRIVFCGRRRPLFGRNDGLGGGEKARRELQLFLFGLLIALRQRRGDLDAVARALAVAQHLNFAGAVALGAFVLPVEPHEYLLAQNVHAAHVAETVGRCHERFCLWAAAHRVLIGVLLVFEAAHEAAAGAGDLGWVQAEVLRLGHLDGHGDKIVQKLRAAEGPAADAETAEHLCLVAHADLPQLDARAKHTG